MIDGIVISRGKSIKIRAMVLNHVLLHFVRIIDKAASELLQDTHLSDTSR